MSKMVSTGASMISTLNIDLQFFVTSKQGVLGFAHLILVLVCRVAANLALKGDITDWAEGAMTAFSAEPEAAPLLKKAPAKKK